MSDFSLPTNSSLYTAVLGNLKDRDVDAITLCVSDPTNTPTSSIKYNRSSDKFQEWSGSAWVDKVISLTGGGTGSSTAGGARTNLGLGTMAVQNSSAVSITGGTMSGVSLNASDLASGTVAVGRLGSGSGGAGAKALFDDNTWKSVSDSFPVGGIVAWPNAVSPSGWQILDGSAISRTTYAVLFALVGTTYGVGDGSTTFNVPDFRGRFVFGKSASGTGSTLGGTFGSIDHTHTSAAHTHTVAGHHHTGPSHTHTIGDHTHHGQGHTHSISSDGSHSHTGTTDFESQEQIQNTWNVSNPFTAPTWQHTHTFTTGSDGSHNHGGATGAGGDVDTLGVAGGAFASGSSGTGNTGDTSLTSDSTTPGATGTNNPPGISMNWIIRLG